MGDQTIISVLPALYRDLLPPFCGAAIPAESLATCASCAMADPAGREPDGPYYDPALKCCTYFPTLPNYLVGGILSDPALEAGRARVAGLIAGRTGVTPFGISASRRRKALYRQGTRGFGRSQYLLCPYYDRASGGCTVWPFRDSVCSTFFCKHAAGVDGQLFWKGLKECLGVAEASLVKHVMRETGWDPGLVLERFRDDPGARQEPQLTARDLDETPPDDREWRKTWEAWPGTPEEFYIRAHHIVRHTGPERFRELCGVSLALCLDNLELLRKLMLDPPMPDPMQRNPGLKVTVLEGGRVRLVSEAGPFEVSEVVYRLLDLFDGRTPTAGVLTAAGEKLQVKVEPSFLKTFYQNRLLIGT
jgi:hypothetical protein